MSAPLQLIRFDSELKQYNELVILALWRSGLLAAIEIRLV
jgi:hypothetical protein